jgi:hypothetical protein
MNPDNDSIAGADRILPVVGIVVLILDGIVVLRLSIIMVVVLDSGCRWW